jgi:hypothetical protein
LTVPKSLTTHPDASSVSTADMPFVDNDHWWEKRIYIQDDLEVKYIRLSYILISCWLPVCLWTFTYIFCNKERGIQDS